MGWVWRATFRAFFDIYHFFGLARFLGHNLPMKGFPGQKVREIQSNPPKSRSIQPNPTFETNPCLRSNRTGRNLPRPRSADFSPLQQPMACPRRTSLQLHGEGSQLSTNPANSWSIQPNPTFETNPCLRSNRTGRNLPRPRSADFSPLQQPMACPRRTSLQLHGKGSQLPTNPAESCPIQPNPTFETNPCLRSNRTGRNLPRLWSADFSPLQQPMACPRRTSLPLHGKGSQLPTNPANSCPIQPNPTFETNPCLRSNRTGRNSPRPRSADFSPLQQPMACPRRTSLQLHGKGSQLPTNPAESCPIQPNPTFETNPCLRSNRTGRNLPRLWSADFSPLQQPMACPRRTSLPLPGGVSQIPTNPAKSCSIQPNPTFETNPCLRSNRTGRNSPRLRSADFSPLRQPMACPRRTSLPLPGGVSQFPTNPAKSCSIQPNPTFETNPCLRLNRTGRNSPRLRSADFSPLQQPMACPRRTSLQLHGEGSHLPTNPANAWSIQPNPTFETNPCLRSNRTGRNSRRPRSADFSPLRRTMVCPRPTSLQLPGEARHLPTNPAKSCSIQPNPTFETIWT